MSSILLERALMTLAALNAQFKVILPDGQEFGELEVRPQGRLPLKYPRGTLQAFVRAFMKDMQVGNYIEIPCNEFLPQEIQTAACNFALKEWGKGTVTTAMNRENNLIEAMRVK